MPANITFDDGDVVKECFHVLLPWIKWDQVGSSANYVEMAQAHARMSPRPV